MRPLRRPQTGPRTRWPRFLRLGLALGRGGGVVPLPIGVTRAHRHPAAVCGQRGFDINSDSSEMAQESGCWDLAVGWARGGHVGCGIRRIVVLRPMATAPARVICMPPSAALGRGGGEGVGALAVRGGGRTVPKGGVWASGVAVAAGPSPPPPPAPSQELVGEAISILRNEINARERARHVAFTTATLGRAVHEMGYHSALKEQGAWLQFTQHLLTISFGESFHRYSLSQLQRHAAAQVRPPARVPLSDPPAAHPHLKPLVDPPPQGCIERPYTGGGGGVPPPPGPPPFLPFQCLRLTPKILLRIRCQEALSFKISGPPSAGTIWGLCEEGVPQPNPPPPPSPPLLIHPCPVPTAAPCSPFLSPRSPYPPAHDHQSNELAPAGADARQFCNRSSQFTDVPLLLRSGESGLRT